MNKEKILAMEAGEEMDTSIGKAFKLYYKNEFRAIVGEAAINFFTELSEAREWHEEFIKKFPNHPYSKNGGHIEAVMIYSPYSTELDKAWKILEQFPMARVEYVEIYLGNKSYSVTLPLETGDINISNAKDLPLTICKVALLAVMDS